MGSSYRYGEKPSSSFLEGDYSWWNRVPSDVSKVPANISNLEINDMPLGNGWRRQRLKPLLKYWLIPSAWSPAFFVFGLISFSLDQINDMPVEIGLVFMLLCPLSLGFSLLFLSTKSDDGNPIKMLIALLSRTRGICVLILIFLVIWLIIYMPSNNNPIWFLLAIPVFLLWFEWFTLGTISLSYPSARWLLPVKHNSRLPLDELEKRNWVWLSDSDLVKKGNIAKMSKNIDGHLQLTVIHYSGTYFLALEWWTKFGTRVDPWLDSSSIPKPPLHMFGNILKMNLNFKNIQNTLDEGLNHMLNELSIGWPDWSESQQEEE